MLPPPLVEQAGGLHNDATRARAISGAAGLSKVLLCDGKLAGARAHVRFRGLDAMAR